MESRYIIACLALLMVAVAAEDLHRPVICEPHDDTTCSAAEPLLLKDQALLQLAATDRVVAKKHSSNLTGCGSVRRRRRNADMTVCRRRHSTGQHSDSDLPGSQWRCNEQSHRMECEVESATVPSATGLSSCPTRVALGGSSIWAKEASSHSCWSPDGIRGDTGFACAGDGTSILVDMSVTDRKVGCFVWATPDCQYPMRSVRKLEFDVEWTGCDGLWMAPLWTFSQPWAPITGRQGLSGEIDFVEECAVPTINTNLGCYNARQGSGCRDAQHWGEGNDSGGVKHIVMTFNGDDLLITVCSGAGVAEGPTCRQVAHYKNYLNVVYPTRDGRDNLYKFMSDIFNDRGGRGDGGWKGCKARRNDRTNCKYAVTKIQIHTHSSRPIFAANSKCAALDVEP